MAQEGHIVGLSMTGGKPTGIIEAPMEAIGCCTHGMIGVRPSKQSYVLFTPQTPHFYRQMLALRGPFERGAPQSPITNSRRKKAATLGLSMRDSKPMGIIEAPVEAIGCCIPKNDSGASGTEPASQIVTSTTNRQ